MAKQRRRRRRGRRRGSWFSRLGVLQKAAVCIGGVVITLIASGVIFVAAKFGQIDTQEIPQEDIVINAEVEEQQKELGEGYLNVALFGVDSREGDLGEGTRTDCLIVASLNKETKEIRMVSVYRDTLLDMSEGTLQKCNAAYSFGGPTQAINMLNMNLDLDIQKYVTVDFGIVAEVIDLLGGVEIDIQEEEVEYLNEYVAETGEVAGKEAKFVRRSGVQLLDGVQATTYARIRSTAGGDFTRTERQRLVIEKMVEKVKKSDIGTINNIIDKVLPTISTNFTAAEILSYAQYFADYVLGENAGFPFDKTTDTISGLGSIVIPVDLLDNVKQLHEFLFGKADYTPSGTVQRISSAIVTRIGQRDITSDEELNSQMYMPSEDDIAQENQQGSDINGNWGDWTANPGDTGEPGDNTGGLGDGTGNVGGDGTGNTGSDNTGGNGDTGSGTGDGGDTGGGTGDANGAGEGM